MNAAASILELAVGIAVEQTIVVTDADTNHFHYIEGNAATDENVEFAVIVVGIIVVNRNGA